MSSILSTQNLQTFLRRKNLRPPSRGGPPGPRPPPKRGRSPPGRSPPERSGRSPLGRRSSPPLEPAGDTPAGAAAFVSSAIILLENQSSVPRRGQRSGVSQESPPSKQEATGP